MQKVGKTIPDTLYQRTLPSGKAVFREEMHSTSHPIPTPSPGKMICVAFLPVMIFIPFHSIPFHSNIDVFPFFSTSHFYFLPFLSLYLFLLFYNASLVFLLHFVLDCICAFLKDGQWWLGLNTSGQPCCHRCFKKLNSIHLFNPQWIYFKLLLQKRTSATSSEEM